LLRKLFSADPARIGRFDAPPTSDAIPASLVDGTPGDLKADPVAFLRRDNVLRRAIDHATVWPYQSFIFLLRELSRPEAC
jgi:D-lactate dehydrogenase